MPESGPTTLCLSGDVMLGRGIDQVLPHPCDPTLHEHYVKSALGYVELAERANGPIGKPAPFDYIWGDALAERETRRPHAWVINLETAITTAEHWEPKGINYRMNPRNIPVLTSAGVDCCTLANNHVLDWGQEGLLETLKTLDKAGIKRTGAGYDGEEAAEPAVIEVPNGRVLVFAYGAASSGIPASWGATNIRPGLNFLDDLSLQTAEKIASQVAAHKQENDVVVASIHWGPNWGYDVPGKQRAFARELVEHGGVDVIFGHSSHHPKGIEIHEGKLILHGCGDFINDYEGITGYESYRGDLALMYFPTVRQRDGRLAGLHIVPLQIRRFRLHHASPDDAAWLRTMLDRESREHAGRFEIDASNTLQLRGPKLAQG
jgi:poly-gamma-glutamate synthesis protein (capsule biosynthesis protein)